MTPLVPHKLRLDSLNTSYRLNLGLEITTPPDSPRLGLEIVSPESSRSFNINKCPSCFKSVFQVEEVSCGGSYWHATCFKCGGPGEFGCQRRLSPADFNLHSLIPYCKPCYSRVLSNVTQSSDMELVDTIQAACSGSARSELPELLDIVKVEKRASIFGPSRRSSTIENNLVLQNRVLCPKCFKMVFKAEEVLATGLIWHKSCFQCGGVNEEVGCHRVLGREDFLQDRGIPYCKACFRRITSKNFELLNTSTSSSLSKLGFPAECSWESDNLEEGGDGDNEEQEGGKYLFDQELEEERNTNNIMIDQKCASALGPLSDDMDGNAVTANILATPIKSSNCPKRNSPHTPTPSTSPFPSTESARLSLKSSYQSSPHPFQALSYPNYTDLGSPLGTNVKSGDRMYNVFFIEIFSFLNFLPVLLHFGNFSYYEIIEFIVDFESIQSK